MTVSDLTIAAFLADPHASPPEALSGQAIAAGPDLIKLLQRNAVTLIPAAQQGSSAHARWLSLAPLAAYLAADLESYAHVRQEYALVRSAFQDAGVPDVLIKSAGLAPSFPHRSGNVDDLVPAGRVAAARAALLSLGYVELRNLEEPRKFFFKRFVAGEEVAAHHLHEHVGWAVSFLDEELIFARARGAADDADLLIPHPEDALLITTAHALYENKAFKLADLVKARHALRLGHIDWERLRMLAALSGWLDGLNILLSIFSRLESALYEERLFPTEVVQQAESEIGRGDLDYLTRLFAAPLRLPLPVSFVFSKRLFYTKCLHDRRRSRTDKLYDVVRHTLNGAKLKLKVHSQNGMLITFSGVDGSGKSAHAQALLNALHRCDIRTSYVWTRGGSSPLASALAGLGRRLLGARRAGGSTQDERARGRRAMTRNPLVRAGWTWLVTLDLFLQYTLRVRLPLLIGRVVVCDRYVYDALADLATDTGRPAGLLQRLLVALSPQPSILLRPEAVTGVRAGSQTRAAFLLNLPLADLQARRGGELSDDLLAASTRTYQQVSRRYDLLAIDNARSFAEANDPLVRAVVRSYFTRYQTLVNGLFMANPRHD